jgi:hypothetical protein
LTILRTQNYTPWPWKLFFSVGNQKKLFYNFNTATDGGLKNRIFERKKLTGCLCHLLGPVFGQTFFFKRKPKKIIFNFKSATDGGLKNLIFEKKI